MVRAVAVDVLVANPIAGPEHEGRPDLPYPLTRLVDVVSTLRRLPGCLPRARVQELEPVQRPQRRGLRGGRRVVDQDRERDLLLADERLGIAAITGSDRDDAGAQTGDLVVVLAQLRGMFAAVQSTEMSEEHHDGRLVAPEITEAVRFSGVVDQRRVREGGEIHAHRGYLNPARVRICGTAPRSWRHDERSHLVPEPLELVHLVGDRPDEDSLHSRPGERRQFLGENVGRADR